MSPELAETRYWGGIARPTNQNWAFAFSAKEKWASKARTDIAKIAGLPRRFQKAFFITNRAVAPKRKSELEAELTKLHGIEVTIQGRAWIVEKVFGNKHEEMAMAALHLDVPKKQERSLGPRDTRRRKRFDELLIQLREWAENLAEMGQFYCDKPGYESLFRTIQQIIIGAVSNLMMNVEARRRGIEMHPKNEPRVVEISKKLKDVVFPTEFFLGKELEWYFTVHLFTCMKQYGFESRGLGYDVKAIEQFMRQRMKHFDVDIEHVPMFGKPPAWWPKLPPLDEVLAKTND